MSSTQKHEIELSRRLRDARVDAGLTQAELAKRLGITRSAVSQYESGRNKPSIAHFNEIARITGKPLSWLVIEDDVTAMRVADGALSDAAVTALRSLPPIVLAVFERKILRAHAYVAKLPAYLASIPVPPPGPARETLLDQVEADLVNLR
jgi:transcriptional regulator with XRE-family HTH domain